MIGIFDFIFGFIFFGLFCFNLIIIDIQYYFFFQVIIIVVVKKLVVGKFLFNEIVFGF